jgi:diguanylate cyclase (GGDEF)-like protein
MAATDPLTGLLNRRGFARAAHPAITRARREERPVAVALLDADRFKLINDGFGHEAGDAVLCGIAAALRSELRAGDLLGRMGGEEFALVLPDTDPQQAAAVAERMRDAVRQLVQHPAGADAAVTLSGGIAAVGRSGEAEIALERALRDADAALYRAKEGGRDCVLLEASEPAL